MNWKFSWQKYLTSQSGQGSFPLNSLCFQDMEEGVEEDVEEEESTRSLGENQEAAPTHTAGYQVRAIVWTLLEKPAKSSGQVRSEPGIPEDFLTQKDPSGLLCPSNVFSQTKQKITSISEALA